MVAYRNESNGVVVELADDHDVELGAQWVEVKDDKKPSPKGKASTAKTD